MELKSVPDLLKLGIVTPTYIGAGKDSLDTNSYRGITLTPVLAKVLESWKDSCAEAIFSTMEAVSQFAQQGERMYRCFYDLQKAFDSV